MASLQYAALKRFRKQERVKFLPCRLRALSDARHRESAPSRKPNTRQAQRGTMGAKRAAGMRILTLAAAIFSSSVLVRPLQGETTTE